MFIVLVVATIFVLIFLLVLFSATLPDFKAEAYGQILANNLQIEKKLAKLKAKEQKLSEYQGFSKKVMALFLKGSEEKDIAKLEKTNDELKRGKLKHLPVWLLPGYVVYRKIDLERRFQGFKTVRLQCFELYGKKDMNHWAKRVFCQVISLALEGIVVSCLLASLLIAMGDTKKALIVLGFGISISLFAGYACYNDVSDKAKKRRAAIQRQYPNVLSKLALLVTSGMIMDRAWRETAESQNGELYIEMQKTVKELDNLVKPAEAYGNFIDRCNTKETTRLAASILQNQSKGNSEIGKLLKEMATEAWAERKSNAKKDSEAANSKLMIPTILMFCSIMAMIMVPVVMSFSGI